MNHYAVVSTLPLHQTAWAGRDSDHRAVYSLIVLFQTLGKLTLFFFICVIYAIIMLTNCQLQFEDEALCKLKWSAFEVRIILHYRGSSFSDVQAWIQANACD